ncbi:MAG: thioredoxin domain-containing protein [Myxococcota bacterium]
MTQARPPFWRLLAMAVVIGSMLFGIGISIYMTMHHEVYMYGGPQDQFAIAGCEATEGVSCDIVNTSAWSEVFGVPTFTWAIPTYLALIWAAVRVMMGRRNSLWLLVLGGVGTCLFSAFLYYISVVELKYICLWCMRLYGINAAVLILSVACALPLGGASWPKMPRPMSLGLVAGVFVAATAISIGVQQMYRATLLGDAPSTDALAITTIDVPENPKDRVDPKGELKPREMQVKTEDGNTATLSIRATDAWKGNPEATVTLVEFADLECGYCKRASVELDQLYRAYGDRVLFVFKHFPLDPRCNPGVNNRKHANACNAALGAICAQDQGKFWAFHDVSFKNQHALKPNSLTANAESLGLNVNTWRTCVTSDAAKSRLTQDGNDGKAIDIHGTPRIYINGQLYRSGASVQKLAQAIERELGLSASEAKARQANMKLDKAIPATPIPADAPAMRTVTYGDHTFRIDTFESALDNGVATSGTHQIPATRMSWFAANDACEAAGKRMCSEQEWLSVCQGANAVDDNGDKAFADDQIEGTAYPYSDFHQPGRCWSARNPKTDRPVYTGEMPGCAGSDKVYDQVGNVEEWVGRTSEEAVLLGGAFDTKSDKARCYRRNDTYGAGYANSRSGFRCCADPSADDAQPTDAPPALP